MYERQECKGEPVRGFTLVELLVVISIIALLISLLLPALGAAKQAAKTAACASGFKQIGTAFAAYQTESGGRVFPYGRHSGVTDVSNPEYAQRWPGWSGGSFFLKWPTMLDEYMGGAGRNHPPIAYEDASTDGPVNVGVVTTEGWICPANRQTLPSPIMGTFQIDVDECLRKYNAIEAGRIGKGAPWMIGYRNANDVYPGSPAYNGKTSPIVPDPPNPAVPNSGGLSPKFDQIKRPAALLALVEMLNNGVVCRGDFSKALPNPLQANYYNELDKYETGHAMLRHGGGSNFLWVDGHVSHIVSPLARPGPIHPVWSLAKVEFAPYWCWDFQ